jgi:hypothetical protein
MTGTSFGNLRTFESICGPDVMRSVVLVTTMWDEVKEEAGVQREAELMKTFWKGMADNGCRTERFYHTSESAWNIVGQVMQGGSCKTLQLQEEMGNSGKSLSETAAHEVIHEGRKWLVDLEALFKTIFRCVVCFIYTWSVPKLNTQYEGGSEP